MQAPGPRPDSDAGELHLTDLDEYRPGPFVLQTDRLPGSRRFMAPEEWRRDATIDPRTTVHALGRAIRVLLNTADEKPAWRGTAAQLTLGNGPHAWTRPNASRAWRS